MIPYLPAVIKFNFHTHSKYSDGTSEPEEYVNQALSRGFHSLGFSEHSPLPFAAAFATKEEESTSYVAEINRLQSIHQGNIELFAAMEMDYIPGFSEGFAGKKKQWGLDYVIGSVHLVVNEAADGLWFIDGPKQEIYDEGLQLYFGGDIRKGVTAYWNQVKQMISKETFEIIGHLDKIRMHNRGRYFNEEEFWYRTQVMETLDMLKEKSIVVEVNTRGIYKKRSEDYFPARWILEEVIKREIPVMPASDAHDPVDIWNGMESCLADLRELGFSSCRIPGKTGMRDIAL